MTPLAPCRPRLAIAGGLLAALTATLSATGVLHGVDQYAVEHLMPWLQVRHHPLVTLGGLTVPSIHPPAGNIALELWTYPAALLPSLVIVLAAAWRLGRRAGLVWCTLWCAGNAIELAGKLSLRKPDLYHNTFHVSAFDTSLPSGHTIRAFVLAGAAATAWRSGRPALVWAVTMPFALVVAGAHVPSDVVTGGFVAMTLAAWAPNVRTA
ncbi:MAG TPA: phosphatase PAP2 family protein [Gaiellaceae bacterium]|nr:phosphatase PAP2 family protein [Gaiellaceae bacterium]